MSQDLYPEFFNDVFGPVMQPGSSSHTAGPCRLGNLARSLLGAAPIRIVVQLDPTGSFAGTFGVMAEDRAMLAGVMGMLPDDRRLFDADRLAAEAGIEYRFEFAPIRESGHPNAVKFILTSPEGREAVLVGASIGGGMVETRSIDGYPLRVKGDTYVLLVEDASAMLPRATVEGIGSRLSGVVEAGEAAAPATPAALEVAAEAGAGWLYYWRVAEPPDLEGIAAEVAGVGAAAAEARAAGTAAHIRPEGRGVRTSVSPRVRILAPVLPVMTRPGRLPQLFATMTRWREIAIERGMPLWEVAVQYEIDASGWSREQILEQMRTLAAIMDRQTSAAYDEGVTVPGGPFKPDFAARWAVHAASPHRLTDDLTAAVLTRAYGAGAGIPGVETVPGPMGGGGGYLYAALRAVKDAQGLSDDDLLRGLFVAAGIGAIAYTRTEPTGEIIGCTGEVGICGAMAAAGLVEMAGGAPAEVENAASLALQSLTGLPCDPIPGGKCQPCRGRALAATTLAVVFADLALAGHEAVLPLHEAIDVADAVGRGLPADLLCTSRGGAAAAPAALRSAAAYRAWVEVTTRTGETRPPGNLI